MFPTWRSVSAHLLGLWLTAGAAFAAPSADRDVVEASVREAETSLDAIGGRAQVLQRRVAPGGSGFITPEEAEQRYQDSVFFFLLGEYERSAEGFFALVATGVLGDSALHRDAEWYLAESLVEMGNREIAEESYLVISEDDAHPFREDAVRRLLEIYAADNNAVAFDLLFRSEILSGRVAASDLITYSVGKAFHTRGEYAKARAYFLDLEPESAYFTRARYYLGAALVDEAITAQGRADTATFEAKLVEALPYFVEILEQPVRSDEERQVLDLALLGVGRIQYELGQFGEAADAYSQIGGDSEFLADKLNEIVWTFIKQEDYQQALRAVEIFLLAFPEHEYAAELKLNQGHLHFREVEYDSALSRYEEVISEYTPVRQRFGELAGSDAETEAYFERVIALDENQFANDAELPAYAVSMMLADEGLARAVDMYREIQRQQEAVSASEAMLAELQEALGDRAGIGTFEGIRYELVVTQSQTLDQALALLRAEAEWLASEGGDKLAPALQALADDRRSLEERAIDVATAVRSVGAAIEGRDDQVYAALSEVEALEEQRDELLTAQVAAQDADDLAEVARIGTALDAVDRAIADLSVDGTEIEVLLARLEREQVGALRAVQADIVRVAAEYASLRAEAGITTSLDPLAQRIDAQYAAVDRTLERLRRTQSMLDNIESTELHRIRQRIDREAVAVDRQRGDLDGTTSEAQVLADRLTRLGFRQLERFFAESVLGADMGVVNVYWSQWIRVGEQMDETNQERADLLNEVERRFGLLEQKLGQ